MTPSPKRSRPTLSWPLSLLAALVIGVGLLLPPEGIPHLTMCWFFAATGLPCPACGLTRSFSAIVHGEFALAWRMNPLGYVFFAGVVVLLLGPLLRRVAPGLEGRIHHPRFWAFVFWPCILALMGFGLLRLYATWHPALADALHIAVWNPR